jgi:predicted TIM-barrel fold metal-dependent hydrolase
MPDLFDIKEIDRQFYQDRLRDFLPEKMIDIHTHVWLDKFRAKVSGDPQRAVTWPSRVALDNSIEDLMETYHLMFPGKQVTPMIFSNLHTRDDDIDGANAYITRCAKEHRCPSLIFAMPWWSAEEFEQKIIAGGFLGAKVYLIFSDPKIQQKDITIFDFLPHHQLEVLDKHGWMVMLHIPRDGRLRDPKNLEQMLKIEKRYPNVKLIIAHVGRAYCNEDVGDAFDVLADAKNMMFDFCANTNSSVFEQLIRAVGPRRILFGSDLPILRMRTRRICENGNYVNIIPKGLYGDVSKDSHMREVEGEEAEKLTFFMYEEIDAFRRAAQATSLSRNDIEDVFYNNAQRLIQGMQKNG